MKMQRWRCDSARGTAKIINHSMTGNLKARCARVTSLLHFPGVGSSTLVAPGPKIFIKIYEPCQYAFPVIVFVYMTIPFVVCGYGSSC